MSEDTEPETEEAPAGKRMLPADWAAAVTEFELGRATKSDLATIYGISRQAMSKGLDARGAVGGSKSKVIADAIVDAAKDAATKKLEDINAMKERQRQRVELIQSLTIKAITDSVKDRKPISDSKGSIATLRSAMAIVATGRNELFHIFDLHRDPDGGDEIPEFIVGEYTQDEIDALNKERLGITDDDLDTMALSLEEPDLDPLGALLDDV